MCYSPWGHKESDETERLNWTELKVPAPGLCALRSVLSFCSALYHGGLVPAGCVSEAPHQLTSTERHWQEAEGGKKGEDRVSLFSCLCLRSPGVRTGQDDSRFTS